MNDDQSIILRFDGDSGDGILSMGRIAARAAARMGYHVNTYTTFPPSVRGGPVTFQVRLGRRRLLSQGSAPDVHVTLNHQALVDYGRQAPAGSVLLYPADEASIDPFVREGVRAVPVAFKAMTQEATGSTRGQNILAMGVAAALAGLDKERLAGVLDDTFGKKGEKVIAMNRAALDAGYAEGLKHAEMTAALRFKPADPRPRMLVTGNEAVAMGALTAGVRFFAGYPITPASEVMEWLAKYLPKVGGEMIQAEDEIASLAMCIGAAYGGVKSMTATSGPGLSLMMELLGLAGMMELPVTIVDVQRAGPSTGMPTKEAQGDLFQAALGTHGEVPKIVVSPRTVADCFTQTIWAVNAAHRYQVPVVVLSSQSLSHRMETVDLPNPDEIEIYEEPLYQGHEGNGERPEAFKRFAMTEGGRPSLRAIPGTPGAMFRAGGLEHDELGNPNFNPEMRQANVERRRERMRLMAADFDALANEDMHLSGDLPIGVVSWGSTASIALEMLETLAKGGVDLPYLFPRVLWPLPDRAMRRFLSSGVRTLLVVELNAMRQFAELIKARYVEDLAKHGVRVLSITKDSGLPFTPLEIHRCIRKILRNPDQHLEGLPVSPAALDERLEGAIAAVTGNAEDTKPDELPDF
jgi:2-oxoglutarate ferredoxin oxidoreductase subunit alpha